MPTLPPLRIAVMSFASMLVAAPAPAQQRAAGDLTLEPGSARAADGTMIALERGRIVVPERRANPDSPLIQLAFVRLKSPAEAPRAPLVYLAGGPGGSSTGFAESSRALQNWKSVLEVCDVILLDQRGTGRSEPDLNWLVTDALPEDGFYSEDAAQRFAYDQCRQAAAHFRVEGRDLGGYTTLEAAHDIDDLRRALGLEKISLMGFSYGTHLALAMIKYHGETLENVIAIGVEGLDMTYKLPLNMDTQFRKIARLAARDPAIGPRVPDLVALYERVAAKLEREPVTVTIANRDGSPLNLRVGKFGLDTILRFDIGDASDLPVFPRLLHDLDRGDTAILAWFVQKRAPLFGRINLMSTLTDAASGASPMRQAMIRDQAQRSMFGNVVNFLSPGLGEAAGAPDLGEDYRAPLVSDVRTLFLTGTLDWNTPPHQAEEVRFGFTNATHITVVNAGHEQVLPHPGVSETMVAFLQGQEVGDREFTAPPLRFVPLEGFDPAITHPSVPRR